MHHLHRIQNVVRNLSHNTHCTHFDTLLDSKLETDADAIHFIRTIGKTLEDCFTQNDEHLYVNNNSLFYLFKICTGTLICLMVINKLSNEINWYGILRKLFFMSIIGGLVCNFFYVYYVAVAKKIAIVTNSECSSSFSITQLVTNFGSWLFTPSPVHTSCEREMIALYVDALWETSPSYVFCLTFTNLFVDPLKVGAESTNKIVRHLFTGLPIIYIPIVVVSLLYVTSLLVMVRYRYLISVPFLLTLTPPSNVCKPPLTRITRQRNRNTVRRINRRPHR